MDGLTAGEFADLSIDQKVRLIENELKQKKEKSLHWNKVLVPSLMAINVILLLAIGGMLYEVKSLELVVIMAFAIFSFALTSILILTGRLGLQLAMLKIPFLRGKAGDVLNIRFKKSGRALVAIEKYNSLIAFDDKTSVAKVLPAWFSEESTGLPAHVAIEGFPLTVDPRAQYEETTLSQHSKLIGHALIEHYYQGRQESFASLDKVLKYLKWILIGLLIVIVVTGATLYFTNSIGTFFEEHKETIVRGVSTLEAYLKNPPPPGGQLVPG